MTEYFDMFLLEKKTYCEKVTVDYYREDVGYFFNYCSDNDINDIRSITKTVLSNYILFLRGTGITNVSVHTYYRAVKVFIRWLFDNCYIDEDPTLKIKLPKKDAKLVIPLSSSEVKSVNDYFSYCENGLRNYCIFHLMIDCGLRRSEVINLNFKDIKENNLYIRLSKNNKSRIVFLPEFLKKSIVNYYNSIPNHKVALFYDRYGRTRITNDSISNLFSNIKNVVGLERVHPHLLRHTFATSYALKVGNLEMLRLLLGHADYNITQNYLHIANQQKLVNADVYEIDDIYLLK